MVFAKKRNWSIIFLIMTNALGKTVYSVRGGNMANYFSIAIDGPVGVGKSTTARLAAKELGFTYVDTGALYRAVAYYLIEKGVDIYDESAAAQAAQNVAVNFDKLQNVYVNGNDVTSKIRTQTISESASVVASYAQVRVKLLDLQRQLAKSQNVVMEGRDIGSFVLPNANLKIYLDAGVDIRARRRLDELLAKGQTATFEDVKNETIIRDERDMNRKESPLVRTSDAILIDTGHKSIEEVVAEIVGLCKKD